MRSGRCAALVSEVLSWKPAADHQPCICWVSWQVPYRRRLDFEVIIVDDNSPDGTQDVVRQLQQAYGEDRIVRHTALHSSPLTSPALGACSAPDGLGHVQCSRFSLVLANIRLLICCVAYTRSCFERGLGSWGWVRLLGLLLVPTSHELSCHLLRAWCRSSELLSSSQHRVSVPLIADLSCSKQR